MVFENTERRFQPSYLPYQVLFIVDAFAFCGRCVVVCTFRETIYSTCVFSRDFSSNCVENACLDEKRSPVCQGSVCGCSNFIFFVIVRF